MLGRKWHFTIYFWMTCIFAFGITWSPFMTSFPIYFLFIHWILEGNFKEKISIAKKRYTIWLYASPFLLFVSSLILFRTYTNVGKELMTIIPIFVLPLVFGTSPPFNNKQIKFILSVFVYCIVATALFNTIRYMFIYESISDYREISFFLNHIRYSLLINLSIFICYYYSIVNSVKNRNEKIAFILAMIYLIFFLFLLQSLTGIIIFVLLCFYEIFRLMKYIKNRINRILAVLSVCSIIVGAISVVVYEAISFFTIEKIDVCSLEKMTKKGNAYSHQPNNVLVENGRYVLLYVCFQELEEEWEKRSLIPFDGKDANNQPINYTILRYLTSKGLRKDAEGLHALSDRDIINIEKGYTNYKYTQKISYEAKLYEIFWQLRIYLNGGDPSTHSVIQRLEFAYCALHAIKENPLLGVGTCAMQEKLSEHYVKIKSKLAADCRRTPHNQFLTISVQHGVVGLLIFLASLFLVSRKENRMKSYLYKVYMIIMLISMINEDTLATQLGIAFYAFIGSLLLFTPKSTFSPSEVSYYSLIDLWNLFYSLFHKKNV